MASDPTSFTATSFGYLIAYFPSGLVALLGLSYWNRALRTIFREFESANADIGLFLLVMILAITASLLLLLFRWILFEVIVLGNKKLDDDKWAKLSDAGKAAGIQVFVEQLYRYHQFYGGMFFASILLFVGWVTHTDLTGGQFGFAIASFVLFEALLFAASFDSLNKYLIRSEKILK